MKLDITNPYSLSEVGDPKLTGASNYVKAIWDSKGESIVFYIWIFDSHSENCKSVKGWGCIEP